MAAPEGPCRGCEAKDVLARSPGAQKHIKIEFTRCPGLAPSSFPFLRTTDATPGSANDVRATPVADAFTAVDLGRRRIRTRHLSSFPFIKNISLARKRTKKKKNKQIEVTKNLVMVVTIVIYIYY